MKLGCCLLSRWSTVRIFLPLTCLVIRLRKWIKEVIVLLTPFTKSSTKTEDYTWILTRIIFFNTIKQFLLKCNLTVWYPWKGTNILHDMISHPLLVLTGKVKLSFDTPYLCVQSLTMPSKGSFTLSTSYLCTTSTTPSFLHCGNKGFWLFLWL